MIELLMEALQSGQESPEVSDLHGIKTVTGRCHRGNSTGAAQDCW